MADECRDWLLGALRSRMQGNSEWEVAKKNMKAMAEAFESIGLSPVLSEEKGGRKVELEIAWNSKKQQGHWSFIAELTSNTVQYQGFGAASGVFADQVKAFMQGVIEDFSPGEAKAALAKLEAWFKEHTRDGSEKDAPQEGSAGDSGGLG